MTSVGVEVLAAPTTFDQRRQGITRTICCTCGDKALALNGASLWCARCLRPFIAAGERFQPSISVRRTA